MIDVLTGLDQGLVNYSWWYSRAWRSVHSLAVFEQFCSNLLLCLKNRKTVITRLTTTNFFLLFSLKIHNKTITLTFLKFLKFLIKNRKTHSFINKQLQSNRVEKSVLFEKTFAFLKNCVFLTLVWKINLVLNFGTIILAEWRMTIYGLLMCIISCKYLSLCVRHSLKRLKTGDDCPIVKYSSVHRWEEGGLSLLRCKQAATMCNTFTESNFSKKIKISNKIEVLF